MLQGIKRRPKIKIIVEAWNWKLNSAQVSATYDITPLVMQYTWQKTIKSAASGCTISCLPQLGDVSLIELLNVMDVVKISEFDEVKFIGYIRKVGFTGIINAGDGKPVRRVQLTLTSVGGILHESQLGLNLFLLNKEFTFQNAAIQLATQISDAIKQTNSLQIIINQLIGFWLNFVTTLSGSSTYASWFNSYIDYSVGLQGTDLPGCLREFTPFTGEEETLSLWDILQKFAAVPFYELWLDTGPRSVSISGTNVQLPSSKEYLVSRVSPFNGYVSPNGATLNFFDAISPKTITLDHLVKYDLNKSMEDVFTFYLTIPAAWDMNNLLLVATGEAVVDQARLSQYLYRPMNVQLFYTRIGTPTKSASVSPDGESQLDTTLKGYAQTLMNWYQFNDRSLSGAIVSMVPSHPENDIRIGDKIEIEGITGDFYVESVAHSWSYGGRLEANINITRGLNGIQPIDLSNKIFRTMRQGQVPSRR